MGLKGESWEKHGKRGQVGVRNSYATDYKDLTLNDLKNQLQELSREIT